MLNKAPNVYTLKNLIHSIVGKNQVRTEIKRVWVPARPLGYYSLKSRFRCAWLAFTGQCDLVKWPEDDPTEWVGTKK